RAEYEERQQYCTTRSRCRHKAWEPFADALGEKSTRASLVISIIVTEPANAQLFLPFGQEHVHEGHQDQRDQDEEARPYKCGARTGDHQADVLWMPDERVQAASYRATLPELAPVDRNCPGEKNRQATDNEQHTDDVQGVQYRARCFR